MTQTHWLAQSLTAQAPPDEATRWLAGEEDEAQVIGLLRACYGDSYRFSALYEPGTLRGLWSSGRLCSLGSVAGDKTLSGHTGLWLKDAQGDYVESGLTLMAPAARLAARRMDEPRVWAWLLEVLGAHVGLLHQSVTSLHAGAQLYAMRHMRATLSGVVPCYVEGERLVGLEEGGGWMHAVQMTSWLRAPRTREVAIPAGPHVDWLSGRAMALGLEPRVVCWEAQEAGWRAETIERIEALDLTRRRVSADGAGERVAGGGARVDLVHTPATEEALGALAGALYGAGFVPAAVRPGILRAHELVWWRGDARRGFVDEMRLARVEWRAEIERWAALSLPPG